MQKEIYLTAYGNDRNADKGIVKLLFNPQNGRIQKEAFYPLDGKANLVIGQADRLVASVKGNHKTTLEFYKKDGTKEGETEAALFYSFACVLNNKLLLASYESGADSVYDLEKNEMIRTVMHQKDGIEKNGKSHFIFQMKDGRCVSVENSLQQLYVYKNENLEVERIVDFSGETEKNIRLLTFSKDEKTAFLNTELTNELIVLDTVDFHIRKAFVMTEDRNTFSGGNAVSEDGKMLCISLRGKDTVMVYAIHEDGMPVLQYEFACGRTPRDLKFAGEYLLVSCTDANSIEVYRPGWELAEKMSETQVFQPITFAVE